MPKFLDKVKAIFRRDSSRARHPPENKILPDVLIAPGPHAGGGTHDSRSDSPAEGNSRGDNVAGDRRPEAAEGRVNGAIPAPIRSDRKRIVGETEHMVPNDILGAADLERQGTNRHETSDWQAVGDVDGNERVPGIHVIDPSSSGHFDHRAEVHRAAAGNQDGELNVPSGRPPIGHSLSESMKFDNIKQSGISIGSGPVNVNNISFSGGIHQHNPSEQIRSGLKILQKHVATSAFHSSVHRIDPPRCHPDTRVAIQKQIYDWILTNLLIRQTWIMWMHGAAGGGKSAIMQSAAELCEKAEIPLASFFFFRTDSTRNSMTPFVATLAYQLIQKIPQLRDEVLGIIQNNELILEESLESQLRKLIIQPLLRLQAHFKCYFVVMIDGLDECLERGHQVALIKLLGTISCSRATPVIFLVASRREPQIEAAFISKQIRDLVLTLPLDNSDIEQTSDDIRRYLVDKFSDIKETHLLKRYLPIDWPPTSSVEEIVSKSSGQFIFASVVINYLSSPRANPARQLEVIRGIRLRDPSSQNPFAHLDALYRHIFLQVDPIELLGQVLDIIGCVLASGVLEIDHIQKVFLLEPGELEALFSDLTAIILCNLPELKFLHASLPDFLVDKARSDQYHIDLDECRTNLLCRFLVRRPPILDPLWSDNDLRAAIDLERSRWYVIGKLLKKAKASERLYNAFMNFNCAFYSKTIFDSGNWYTYGPNILQYLKQLDFSDQGEAYQYVIDIFSAEYTKYWSALSALDKHIIENGYPDLMARIKQIREQ